jgi:hypothetical protein
VTDKKSNPLWVIFAALLLGILIVAGYKYKDAIKPNATETAALDASCDLRQGACTSQLASGGKISFSIDPHDIQILKPLTLQVKTEGMTVTSASVDFVGIGMDMGFNRSKLTSVDQMNFKGDGMLPICSENKMHWEARVQLQTDKGSVIAPFRFHTER